MNLSRTQIMFSKLIPLLFLPFISISGADIITLTLAAPGGSKFDNLVINAAGQAFYAGLETPATYCPTVVQQCPHNGTSTETVFGNLAALWVAKHRFHFVFDVLILCLGERAWWPASLYAS